MVDALFIVLLGFLTIAFGFCFGLYFFMKAIQPTVLKNLERDGYIKIIKVIKQ